MYEEPFGGDGLSKFYLTLARDSFSRCKAPKLATIDPWPIRSSKRLQRILCMPSELYIDV